MSLGRKAHFLVTSLMLLALAVPTAFAKDKEVRIPLPKRSKPTPVQNLNREGVKALSKHDYDKAKKLFYQAYLLDPNDPFTLNNLGYVSELEGEVDRAQRFYALAAEQNSDAKIDRSTSDSVLGKPVSTVAGKTNDVNVRVNRYNVEAISLLNKDRAPEADMLLHKALALDRHNAFTLNNLGYAQEKEGELEQALSFYSAAAATGTRDAIVVTANGDWRGRAISDVASDNADKLRKLMRKSEGLDARVARLNLRGVSAINRNERHKARDYFEQAYKLNPRDAFTLNNMGYLSELDGDRETAKFYYEKAEAANRSKARVEVATRKEAEGKPLAAVADQSTELVHTRMQADVEARRSRGGPVLLMRRDNTPVVETSSAPAPRQPESIVPGGSNEAPAESPTPQLRQRPKSEQPPAQQQDETYTPAVKLPSSQTAPSSAPAQQPETTVAPPAPPSTQGVPPPSMQPQ